MTDAEFQIRVSYNYHKKRERFFRLLDAAGKFVSILALSALITKSNALSVSFAGFSAIVTILSVVFDFSGSASRHESLAVDFLDVLRRLVAKEISAEQAGSCCREIGAREPTVLRGLAQLCQDEQEAALGQHVEPSRLGLRRRIAAHLGFGDRPIDYV